MTIAVDLGRKAIKQTKSYDLLNAILSPSKFVYFSENLHCCDGCIMTLLVLFESVM